MLEGLRSNEIIVGAYSRDGGICPMLAAHRAGGRTSMISFARAWDRFALTGRNARPRPATPRELRILVTHLEASLLEDEAPRTELGAAIAAHQRLLEHREQPSAAPRLQARPSDADRTLELSSRPGWAWSRLMRSYSEYERALRWIDGERDAEQQREHQPA
jgi:hypothetical protein